VKEILKSLRTIKIKLSQKKEIWKNTVKSQKYRFFHKISKNFSGLRTPGIYYVDTAKFLCKKTNVIFFYYMIKINYYPPSRTCFDMIVREI